MTKIIIDPSVCMQYSSFYIKGLEEVFGKNNISFSEKYFTELQRRTESHSYGHYMGFVAIDDDFVTKIIVDFRDKVSVKESAYNWCDIYAKINFNWRLTDSRFHAKMVSIPPGFGINTWSLFETCIYSLSNLIKSRRSLLVSLESHFRDYLAQYRFSRIDEYLTSIQQDSVVTTDENYVFSISTLWPHKNCIEATNLLRKEFVEACKADHRIRFEGGFCGNSSHPQFSDFKAHMFIKPYSKENYIKNTIKSLFVFNTPSVHNCHGWKLGEYLAMGKAIISTPLSNVLPEELVHGSNVHIVSDVEELHCAIDLLLIDPDYRKHLEDGARAYYAKHVSPKNVIKNIFDNVQIGYFGSSSIAYRTAALF